MAAVSLASTPVEQMRIAKGQALFQRDAMEVGQRVVCINDKFEPWVTEYYDQLPVQGEIYTIRGVSLGRGTLVGSEMAEVRLLLEELHNGSDPHHKGGDELGFRSDRFAPFEEEELAAAADEEAHIGFPMNN